MTEVTAYNNPNAPIHRQWIAYVVMDNGKLWGVYSTADTEESARVKIANLWESERARVSLNPQPSGHKPEPKPAPASLPASWDAALMSKAPSAFKGMVWLVNIVSRAKTRVSAETAEAMLASGEWIKGGPRSR